MRLFGQKALFIWGVGLVTAFFIWLPQLLSEDAYSRLNNLVFDAYQQQKPREWANSSVVVLDIDENSIDRIGQWPWPRNYMASMVRRLDELGAAVIVFDIVFSEADRTSPINSIDRLRSAGIEVVLPIDTSRLDNDQQFATAIAKSRVVTGLVFSNTSNNNPPEPKAGYGLSGTLPPQVMHEGTRAIRNLEIFDRAAKGIGLFSLSTNRSSDGIIRKVRLLTGVDGQFYPTLGVEALRVAQGAGSFKIKSSDGSGEVDAGDVRLTSIQVGALEVKTDALGDMAIYHSRRDVKPALAVHALMNPSSAGLSEQDIASLVEDRIVLVGTSAAGLLDLRSTPVEPVVPGVFIHADVIDQIISGTYLVRPDYATGVELFTAILAVVILLAISPFVGALWAGVTAIVLCLLAVWYFWHLFSSELLLLSPLLLLVSVLATYILSSTANFLFSQREGAFLRGAFSQYLSPALVNELTKNPEKLVLGGETRELTLLFCDIRGFTSLSEKLNPTELTQLLNNFLTPMTGILLNNGATIDKYMGDAIMAFWNAPIEQQDHRERACRSVHEMRDALRKLNKDTDLDLHIGIGLNTGPGCVGNLGSEQRFSYSAIGDAVNVASRIEGLTKQYGLDNLASGETVKTLDKNGHIQVDFVRVVGRAEPLPIHYLINSSSFANYEKLSLFIERHSAFLNEYKNGSFQNAAELLRELQAEAPDDLQKLYSTYEERLQAMKTVPPEWDGVYNASEK